MPRPQMSTEFGETTGKQGRRTTGTKRLTRKQQQKKNNKDEPWESDKDPFQSTSSPAVHCFELKAPVNENKKKLVKLQ